MSDKYAKLPPIEIACGSKIFIKLEIPTLKSVKNSSTISIIAGLSFSFWNSLSNFSPSIFGFNSSSSIIYCLNTFIEPYCSKHPRLPQLHGLPFCLIIICPNSNPGTPAGLNNLLS